MSTSTAAPVTVYVPRDSAATSVGADEVADALVRAAAREQRPIQLIRNGSRGLLWLEPLVEVATPEGRIGYGPVTPAAGRWPRGRRPVRRRRPPVAGGCGRGPALAGDAESGHLRQGRRHRSVVARRLSEPRRPRRTAAGTGDVSGRRGRGGHGLRAARAWRRRLPGRHQVEDRPRMRRRTEVRLLQRRRGRQRNVRRPDGDGGRPVHAHRGHDDRGIRRRRERGVHLHPVGVSRRGGRDAFRHRDRTWAGVARRQRARLVG